MQYCDGKANPQNLIILAFILPYKHGIQLRVNDINKNAESLTKGLQQTQNFQQMYLLWVVLKALIFVPLYTAAPYLSLQIDKDVLLNSLFVILLRK